MATLCRFKSDLRYHIEHLDRGDEEAVRLLEAAFEELVLVRAFDEGTGGAGLFLERKQRYVRDARL